MATKQQQQQPQATTQTDLQLYQQPQPHELLVVPEDMPFAERKQLLAFYTRMKAVEGLSIDDYLGKSLHMTGVFQHRIMAKPAHINRSTGEQVPASDGWVRTIIYVQEHDKPFSLGSDPVAETVSDIIKVLGHGMFPQGESVPFHIEARGKRPAQYYVLIVEEEEVEL